MFNNMQLLAQQRRIGVMDHVPQHILDAALAGENRFHAQTIDAATAAGGIFLQSELEKRDPKVREPLTSVTWMRDIVVETGGGYVDFTSVFNVNYATAGSNLLSLAGGQSNAIPIVQADLGKDVFPVYPWMNVLKVPFLDMQKMQGIGRSLDQILDTGIKLNYNKFIDFMVYRGNNVDKFGITNNTSIPYTTAAAGAASGTTWATKTPEEILYDINTLMVATWAASGYDVTGMANYILIPPSQFSILASRIISLAGNVSILTYLLENNIGKTQGVELQIFPCKWCVGTTNGGPNGDGTLAGPGSGGTDRMIGYVNEKDRLYFDITVPISRAMTSPSVRDAAYLTLYAAMVGVPKFLYYSPCAYVDGI